MRPAVLWHKFEKVDRTRTTGFSKLWSKKIDFAKSEVILEKFTGQNSF